MLIGKNKKTFRIISIALITVIVLAMVLTMILPYII